MPTKLQVPEGCGGVSHAGVSYTPDENGIIEIEDGVDIAPLFDHGLTHPTAEAKQAAGSGDDDAKREELFNRAVEMGLKPHYKLGVEKLQALITEAEEAKAAEAKQAAGSGE